MIRSYLLSVSEMLRAKPWGYSLSILSLALSLAFFILSMAYVHYESHYDQWIPGYKNIYRIELELNGKTRASGMERKDYSGIPEILEFATSLIPGGFNVEISYDERKHFINFNAASDNFLHMMGIGVIRGQIQNSNPATYYLAISERKAVEIFGSVENALGERIKPSNKNLFFTSSIERSHQPKHHEEGIITAVFRDVRPDSHMKFDLVGISPFIAATNYVLLEETASIEKITEILGSEFKSLQDKKIKSGEKSNNPSVVSYIKYLTDLRNSQLTLIRISDIYLFAKSGGFRHGDSNLVTTMTTFAFVLLSIGAINLAGLLVTQYSAREKEFIMRKICGSSPQNLSLMVLMEVILITGIACVLAALLVYLLASDFKQYVADFNLWLAMGNGLWGWIIIALFVVVLISVFMPILNIYNLNPAAIFRGFISQSLSQSTLVMVFVGFEVALAVVVIITALTMAGQVQHVSKRNFPFDVTDIYFLHTYGTGPNYLTSFLAFGLEDYFQSQFQSNVQFEAGLKRIPGVVKVGQSVSAPFIMGTFLNAQNKNAVQGGEQEVVINSLGKDFFATLDISLLAGNEFSDKDFEFAYTRLASRNFLRNSNNINERENSEEQQSKAPKLVSRVIINEAMLQKLGYSDPREAIGKRFNQADTSIMSATGNESFIIIGVTPNLYIEWTFGRQEKPAIYIPATNGYAGAMVIKYVGSDTSAFIKELEQLHKSSFPGMPDLKLDLVSLEGELESILRPHREKMNIFLGLSVMAIFIAGIGLHYAVQFTVSRQRREMAIRKVFGSSSKDIAIRVFWAFLKPVIAANIVAWPIAFLIMSEWLQQYSDRIQPGISMFITAGLISILLVVVVVGREAWRMARAMPYEGLLVTAQ